MMAGTGALALFSLMRRWRTWTSIVRPWLILLVPQTSCASWSRESTSSGPRGQHCHESKLGRRERQILGADHGAVPRRLDHQLADAQLRRLRRWRVGWRRAAQHRLDARQQVVQLERFVDEVVGA